MIDMSNSKQPVHRSLLQREMIGGVPQAGLFIIFMLVLVLVYGFELYLSLVPIALLYFLMRHFTKQDQWFIDMILENIMQKDKLIP
jgi:type IV secretory pathway VirB3-like protein